VLSRDALDVLLAHSWPGNVRELENCLARALIIATGDVIRPEHISLAPRANGAAAQHRLTTLEQVERDHVAHVIGATRGHKARAAAILGVSRPRLDRLLKKYDIEVAEAHE
jgi:two-component system NtrC family response regulator